MEKNQRGEIGGVRYLNKNCWLAKSLNYPPYKRCQYCELKFRHCVFLHYQIISVALISFFLTLSLLIEGSVSKLVILVIISVFTLVIIYGYFFNKSTDKIIQANFAQKKANEALEELSKHLQQKVDEQTKALREAYQRVENAYHLEKSAKEELEHLDKVKNQFLLATQHHLRTPMTAIMGYIDLILKGTYGKQSKKTKDVIKKLQTSTSNLIKMVNEFLDVTQFQLGKEVLSLKPNVQLEQIMKEIMKELTNEAESKGIYLKLQRPEKPHTVVADAQKLKAAIFNIIDNAIKYTQKGGVTITCQKQNNRTCRMMIKDTGIGISPENIKNIFSNAFERGEQAKKVFATGRGIGLYIASQIIAAHHGKVWVESEGEGRGSTFYVELPIE